MNQQLMFSILALAGLSVGCSTVHVTRLQPGRGGELAVQEGLFGEPARVKAERVMQNQCPEGFAIDEEADVKVGTYTVTQAESAAKVSKGKVASATTTVSETQDKTERRISWKCKNAAAEVPPVSPKTEPAAITSAGKVTPDLASPKIAQVSTTILPNPPVEEQPSSAAPSVLTLAQPTGWSADFGIGRRWYKPSDQSVSHFHSTNIDIRLLYELYPGVELGGTLHVDGYDNDSNAADEDFTSSLFELGVTGKLSHRFGILKPYIMGNYFVGAGNREYEREMGFVAEKYSGKNSSSGADGALGLALSLGEGSLYFEWYRSTEREMKVKGRLERQTLYPNGAVSTTVEGDKRSFKTRYDGFAVGFSFPIKH